MPDSPARRLLSAAATVGGFTMLSRIAGFARDILIAALVGAGPVADAFFVAFRLPSFFRRLFAEGAFQIAFVPAYAEALEKRGAAAAQAFAESVLSVLLGVLILCMALAQLAMPVIIMGVAPGFLDDPAKFELAVTLARITLPYIVFISLVTLLSGLLNCHGRFAVAAATPILLNLCLIAALLVLTPRLPTPGHALAVGVFLGGLAQFVWLMLAMRRAGLSLRLPRPRLTPGVRHVLRLMAPSALGGGVMQINLLVGTVLASILAEGSISFLFYADRLNQLPIGVVGVAVGTALLPLLSRQAAAGEYDAARQSLNRALELCIILALPAAAALLAIPHTLIAALFERGAFTARDTAMTAWALSAYAAGLPAMLLLRVLGAAYFARQDMTTPVRIAIVTVVVNIVMSLILMGPMLHAGLALATTISAWVNAGLLGFVLLRRDWFAPDRRLLRAGFLALAASVAMAAALALGAEAMSGRLPAGEFWRIGGMLLLVAGGSGLYGGLAWITGLARPRDVLALLRKPRPQP